MEQKTRIAVVALVYFDDRILFLKRNNPPCVWQPPGGRVRVHEGLEHAAFREVYEETGISCQVIMPVSTWLGIHDAEELYSITFVCKADSNIVTLSKEHSDYIWIPYNAIAASNIHTDMQYADWAKYIDIAKMISS